MKGSRSIRTFWNRHGQTLVYTLPAVVYALFFALLIGFTLLQLALTGDNGAFPSLQHFREIPRTGEFWHSLGHTVAFVLVGTPLQLLAGLGLALLIVRPFKGRGLVRGVFLLPVAIPGLVIAVIFKTMLFDYPLGHVNDAIMTVQRWIGLKAHPVNWYGSPSLALGLALTAKVWRDMPISMLILLAGLQSIGQAQYEAARTMGASMFQRFRYITLPALAPAIATVLILRSIEIWKAFLFPFVIAPSYPVLGVLIHHYFYERRAPEKAAALALILLALIAAFSGLISLWLKRSLPES